MEGGKGPELAVQVQEGGRAAAPPRYAHAYIFYIM